jgi:MFS family permease
MATESQSSQAANASLEQLDDSGITRTQWKVLLTSSMGFFTDAYDLFIIGAVMRLLESLWQISMLEKALVTSTALLASAVGAVIFGRAADLLGRKRIYGYEVLVLAAGAIASACSPNIWWLIGFRIVLGLGIGGDYPVSSTLMSEYAGKRSRGFLIALVFASQGVGLIVGPLTAVILLSIGMNHELTWRVMLAIGAIPALSVFYLRRQIRESPRFLLASGAPSAGDATDASVHRTPADGELRQFLHGRLLARLIGACAAWFLMDFAYYGNTVSSTVIVGVANPEHDLMRDALILLGIFALAAFPGYFVTAFTIDRLGRRTIQIIGFLGMAATFAAMGFIPDIAGHLWLFLGIFGLSFFFTEFGPNTTTFIYPAEIFPVHLRTTGHGLAASAGKVGGFVGVFLFPYLMQFHGLAGAELVAAGVSLLGAVVTAFLLPETKGRSLEELSEDAKEERATTPAAALG